MAVSIGLIAVLVALLVMYVRKKGAEIMTVREICERYTLTHTALAKRFDIPLRTVQDWYAGKRVPPPYVVKMMVELIERSDGAV